MGGTAGSIPPPAPAPLLQHDPAAASAARRWRAHRRTPLAAPAPAPTAAGAAGRHATRPPPSGRQTRQPRPARTALQAGRVAVGRRWLFAQDGSGRRECPRDSRISRGKHENSAGCKHHTCRSLPIPPSAPAAMVADPRRCACRLRPPSASVCSVQRVTSTATSARENGGRRAAAPCACGGSSAPAVARCSRRAARWDA